MVEHRADGRADQGVAEWDDGRMSLDCTPFCTDGPREEQRFARLSANGMAFALQAAVPPTVMPSTSRVG